MKHPTLFDILEQKAHNERVNLHTALPCRVLSFNPIDNSVTLEAMLKQQLSSGEYVDLPPLVDVPVQFPRAGKFAITLPICKGDEGIAIFSERCIDGWFATGEKSKPLDARTHDYSDAFFIAGVSSRPKVIYPVFNDGLSLQTLDASTYVRITQGKILIKGDIEHIGNSHSSGSISAAQILANDINLTTHTHPETGTTTGVPNQ